MVLQDLHPVLTVQQQDNLAHYAEMFRKIIDGATAAGFDETMKFAVADLNRRPSAVMGEL